MKQFALVNITCILNYIILNQILISYALVKLNIWKKKKKKFWMQPYLIKR